MARSKGEGSIYYIEKKKKMVSSIYNNSWRQTS